jgi:hypothetical protein
VQSKNFYVEAKSMLEDEKNLLCTEPDGMTAMTAGLITTQTSQFATRHGQTIAQFG